jgi:hypothetical protein
VDVGEGWAWESTSRITLLVLRFLLAHHVLKALRIGRPTTQAAKTGKGHRCPISGCACSQGGRCLPGNRFQYECWKIRAASMRLDLPHQRVKQTVKLDSANVSMCAIERSKEIYSTSRLNARPTEIHAPPLIFFLTLTYF